jgi:endogenous inhibitor of DNA gyrase (YacG/DUF329 family)
MSEPSKIGPSEKPACPICGKPALTRFAPFCSRRCADLDLGRWLKGGYVIPAAPEEAETADESADQPPEEEGK